MRRDLELAVAILLEIESKPIAEGWHELTLDGYSDEEISYHIKLLHGVGMVDAINLSTKDGMQWGARDLTWKGHDFLEDTRKTVAGTGAKAVVGLVGQITKDVVVSMGPELLRKYLGGATF